MRDPWLSQRQAFHDAANWLTVLLGHLEILREEPDSGRHLELARRAARAAHRLCALPPGSSGPRSTLDVVRHGERAVDHLRGSAQDRGVDLQLACGALPPVSADAPGLDDALLNLLRNGLEATPEGGRVTLEIERAGPGFVRIRALDGGPGVPADQRAKIGVVGHSTKSGTDRGLGLSRVRNWLASLGTDLEIEDAPGGGAAIGFTLATAPADSPRPEADGSALEVLLVEDDLAVAEVLSLLLGSDGHRVEQAPDLATAEQLFAPGRFRLVLCDQNLPDGAGEELVRRFLEVDPGLTCFLVTGAPESVHCSDDSRLGLLAKPVSRDDLRRAAAEAATPPPDPASTGDE